MVSDNRVSEIRRFRFRLGAILVMRECLRLFFAWIMVWALAVVGLRAVLRVDPLVLLWGSLGLAGAAAVGIFLGARKTPSAAAMRAVLDGHGRLGGLLMAAGDTDIGAWQNRMASPPMPAIQWQSRRPGMLLVASIGFLAAAFLAPDRYLPTGNGNTLQIGGEAQKLAEKIEVLKQEQVLPPEKAESLEKDLQHVRQEALGSDPAKTIEAIDHLEQALDKVAAESAESAINETECASRMEELASALESVQGQMNSEQFDEAMKELAHMAEQAAAESQSLAGELSDELKNALEQGSLTDAQLKELCKALKACKASQRAKIAKLVNAKLVDAEKLNLCDKAGECDGEALAAALGECDDGAELAECLACAGQPGRGGVSRGRGDAAMCWQDEVQKKNANFKEKVLPPAAVASLKDSQLVGVSTGDPTAAKPGGSSSGGALASAQAGGGEARTQVILPEHEKTVQRYFNREKK